MFRHKMDLTLKVCIMPFTEFEFFEKDHIDVLRSLKEVSKYREYFDEIFVNIIYGCLNRTQQIRTLDEINLLFEKFYPKEKLNERDTVSDYYLDLFSKLAKYFITHRSGRIALKYWESAGEEDFLGPYKGVNKIALWNSLNRMFTTDLLVVKYLLDNEMDNIRYLDGYYSQIMIEDLQLKKVFEKGVAETHLHTGAGIHFYISWQYLMNFTTESLKSYEKELLVNTVMNNQYGLENYVKAIALVRIILAKYLKNQSHLENMSFESYMHSSIHDDQLKSLLTDISKGNKIDGKSYSYTSLWNALTISLNSSEGEPKKTYLQKDILTNIFSNEKNINTSIENIFLFRALSYISTKQDTLFQGIFWQYIRIKNQVFQLKVQGNLIRGLDHFQKYYKRSTEIKMSDEEEFWRIVLHNQFQNKNIKKLELRIGAGIFKNKAGLKRTLKNKMISFFTAYEKIIEESRTVNSCEEKIELPAVGIVFHFIKEKDRTGLDKCWNSYKDFENSELYFRELQEKYFQQIDVINELRNEVPGLDEYIVGIDAASIENNTDPWVFAPVYERARDCKMNKLFYSESRNKIKELGFTFHVGEDFRHLLTGIRRIDEVVEHFKFHAGDRIGHGIALGVNVEDWISRNAIVIMTRIEYMENLIWLWGLYKDGKYAKTFDISYLEQEIMRQAEMIYIRLEGITIYNLWKAYINKFNIFKISNTFEIQNTKNSGRGFFCLYVQDEETYIWNEEKLTHAQHCKCYLEKMLEPIQVAVTDTEAKMLKEAQRIVTSKVSREGIVIETNPSSNLAIGEITSIFEHYIFNLNQRGLKQDINAEKAVMISINSDDPSVFNTNVSNELAYIFYALLEQGFSREDALFWIDKVREYGMISSFIDDRNITLKERSQEIKQIIAKIKEL